MLVWVRWIYVIAAFFYNWMLFVSLTFANIQGMTYFTHLQKHWTSGWFDIENEKLPYVWLNSCATQMAHMFVACKNVSISVHDDFEVQTLLELSLSFQCHIEIQMSNRVINHIL